MNFNDLFTEDKALKPIYDACITAAGGAELVMSELDKCIDLDNLGESPNQTLEQGTNEVLKKWPTTNLFRKLLSVREDAIEQMALYDVVSDNDIALGRFVKLGWKSLKERADDIIDEAKNLEIEGVDTYLTSLTQNLLTRDADDIGYHESASVYRATLVAASPESHETPMTRVLRRAVELPQQYIDIPLVSKDDVPKMYFASDINANLEAYRKFLDEIDGPHVAIGVLALPPTNNYLELSMKMALSDEEVEVLNLVRSSHEAHNLVPVMGDIEMAVAQSMVEGGGAHPSMDVTGSLDGILFGKRITHLKKYLTRSNVLNEVTEWHPSTILSAGIDASQSGDRASILRRPCVIGTRNVINPVQGFSGTGLNVDQDRDLWIEHLSWMRAGREMHKTVAGIPLAILGRNEVGYVSFPMNGNHFDEMSDFVPATPGTRIELEEGKGYFVFTGSLGKNGAYVRWDLGGYLKFEKID